MKKQIKICLAICNVELYVLIISTESKCIWSGI